jgi:hypothetical protein
VPQQSREYSLADLVNDPAAGLKLRREGLDRRSLELLLEPFRQARNERQPRLDAPSRIDGVNEMASIDLRNEEDGKIVFGGRQSLSEETK